MKVCLTRAVGVVLVVASAVVGVHAIAACSSDDTKSPAGTAPTTTTTGTSTPPEQTGETKTKIGAAGGTVSDPSGNATLTIPPNALDQETEITLRVSAASGGAVSSIYDFGPDGTTFKTPATLQVKTAGLSFAAGATPTLAIAAGGTFTALAGSSSSAGAVTAPVPHFTGFAVIGVPGSGTNDAGKDDAGTNDAGKDAAVADAGADASGGGDCAFVGSYVLETYACGATDITSSWKSIIPSDELVVTNRAGGGCTLKVTHVSSACNESETFAAKLTSGSAYTVDHLGITSCTPAACKFTSDDAPCSVGDRVFTESATITAEGTNKLRYKAISKATDPCAGAEMNVLFGPVPQ